MNIGQLMEFHELAKKEGQKYDRKRSLYKTLTTETGKHLTGIVGPRGAGKTVILKQLAAENQNAFYLSADVLEPETDLFPVIRQLTENFKFRIFLLDEIHFLTSHSALLKQIYDFLDVKVFFTSSVALAMHSSAHDLSRRARLLPLHYLSFREYLRLVRNIDLPKLDLASIAARQWQTEHLREGHYWNEYLIGGQLPFSFGEPSPLPLLKNIIEKIINKDIPSTLRLTMDELQYLKKLMNFVGRSAVDGINYSSISQNVGITKYKAEQYVSCLEKAFVLHQVFPAGTNVLKEPKILMAPPCRLLYRDYDDAIGGLREDFFAEMMKLAGMEFHYLKSVRGAKTPDYLVVNDSERLVIEIGGKGKGREQFKGIKAERKLIFAHADAPDEKRLPLFLLGYLS